MPFRCSTVCESVAGSLSHNINRSIIPALVSEFSDREKVFTLKYRGRYVLIEHGLLILGGKMITTKRDEVVGTLQDKHVVTNVFYLS